MGALTVGRRACYDVDWRKNRIRIEAQETTESIVATLQQQTTRAMLCLLFCDLLGLPVLGDSVNTIGNPEAQSVRPNVLFIAVDDLNDWIGCLGGHPQAKTPNIDRFAARAMNFTNAHCQAPVCNASRISLLTGTLPSSTGIYYLGPRLRQCETTREAVSLPQHFAHSGYKTMAAGKIFHAADADEFQEYAGRFTGFGPSPETNLNCGHVHPLWDWGAFPETDDQLADYSLATWTVQQLEANHDKPFFLGCGFFRPHVPLYVPQKWFDLYPLETLELPPHQRGDLSDVPEYGQDLSWSAVAPRHGWMVQNDQWLKATQAYLASVSFVDHQIGRVLNALEKSSYAKNTIVVLWSDHGFHLGTKDRWGKRSLWEASTRVVLMMSAPGIAPAECERPVGLIDLYPTLIEMCQLDAITGLEGHSLVPLIEQPDRAWAWPAITSWGQHNHAVRTQHYRYITYADGSEELYDHRIDPYEFENLAKRPELQGVRTRHRRLLPQVNHPLQTGSHNCDAKPGSAADIDGKPTFRRKPTLVEKRNEGSQ